MKNVSLKVVMPVLVNLAVGGSLVVLGERELGIGVLLAAANNAGVGYMTPHSRKGADNA